MYNNENWSAEICPLNRGNPLTLIRLGGDLCSHQRSYLSTIQKLIEIMTSHFLTFQVGVSSNYRKFNLEDLLGKNLKNCSAKLPSQF